MFCSICLLSIPSSSVKVDKSFPEIWLCIFLFSCTQLESTYSSNNLCRFNDQWWWRWWSYWSGCKYINRPFNKWQTRCTIWRYNCFNKYNPANFVKANKKKKTKDMRCKDLFCICSFDIFFNIIIQFFFLKLRKVRYNGGAQQNLRERYNHIGISSFSIKSIK